ncbi:MAG: flagellar basal body P-ring formation chaperone FlgA [Synergistaceae bacterium]|nr:flagellar basal body P-ring formation chaperone FlgA [Synergistaceae bacterium]
MLKIPGWKNTYEAEVLNYHASGTYVLLFLFLKAECRLLSAIGIFTRFAGQVLLPTLVKCRFCFVNLVLREVIYMQLNFNQLRRVRRAIPLLFFISVLLTSQVGVCAADVDVLNIRIADSISTAFGSFTLSEIADIEGPREASRIAGMLRFSAPDSKILYREKVIDALQKSSISGVRIELRMPSEVPIEVIGNARQTGEQSSEDWRYLREAVKKLSNWKYDVDAVPQGKVPPGQLSGPASIVPGSASTNLKFRDSGGEERSVLVRLTWYQPVQILKRSIKRGEIIRAEDIGERSVKIVTPNVYASSPEEVTGKSIRKSQQQGEMILLSLITDVPIIQKGKIITLFINLNGLTIESKGEALQSGYEGNVISVKNLASKKTVSGVIRSPDRVEVLK